MLSRFLTGVLAGEALSAKDVFSLASVEGAGLFRLFSAASEIREKFRKNVVDLCSIINAKSGACSEDCSYCAQSSRSKAEIPVHSLLKENEVMAKAIEAKEAGIRRFCIVTSGRKAGSRELREIASMMKKIRGLGLLPCATLGLLDKDELSMLRESGLERYHHNLETSERFFLIHIVVHPPDPCVRRGMQEGIRK